MSRSDALKRAQKRYRAKAQEQLNLTLPKGTKGKIQQLSILSGESMAAYILTAIKERAEREGMAWDNIVIEAKTADNQDNTGEKDHNQATSDKLYPIGYKVEG